MSSADERLRVLSEVGQLVVSEPNGSPVPPPDDALAPLLDRVAQLEADLATATLRVDDLETRVAALEAAP